MKSDALKTYTQMIIQQARWTSLATGHRTVDIGLRYLPQQPSFPNNIAWSTVPAKK